MTLPKPDCQTCKWQASGLCCDPSDGFLAPILCETVCYCSNYKEAQKDDVRALLAAVAEMGER